MLRSQVPGQHFTELIAYSTLLTCLLWEFSRVVYNAYEFHSTFNISGSSCQKVHHGKVVVDVAFASLDMSPLQEGLKLKMPKGPNFFILVPKILSSVGSRQFRSQYKIFRWHLISSCNGAEKEPKWEKMRVIPWKPCTETPVSRS